MSNVVVPISMSALSLGHLQKVQNLSDSIYSKNAAAGHQITLEYSLVQISEKWPLNTDISKREREVHRKSPINSQTTFNKSSLIYRTQHSLTKFH